MSLENTLFNVRKGQLENYNNFYANEKELSL
jgi:hypothetical protein